MGLDTHYPDPPLALQQSALEAQLVSAAQSDLPIIIHNRKATEQTLSILRGSGIDPARFVFHCFTGSRQELDQILDFGAMVSLTGIVTFSSARDLAEASDAIPSDRLMLETDAPYLTPAPHRKVHPNEPKFVPLVAQFLADRRGMSVEELTAACDANAERFFFGLKSAPHPATHTRTA
jgi:TatD DNase family protein